LGSAAPETGQKQGSRGPKTDNWIANSAIIKIWNPRPQKHGTRKLAKGGYHAPLQSACFQCFSILLARTTAFPAIRNGLPAVLAASSKTVLIGRKHRQAGRLTQMAPWDRAAKKLLENRRKRNPCERVLNRPKMNRKVRSKTRPKTDRSRTVNGLLQDRRTAAHP
jgi:hypothetical protein